MLLLNLLINTVGYLYILNPLYVFNELIKNLQITSDPDTYLTPFINQHDYYVESHTVRTQDGYILELHRIPFAKTRNPAGERPPVLLCHGVLYSSYQWIVAGPNKSLGYRLADEGYDVWLINFRGNTFSRAHFKYTPKQKEFWDYSVHELGIYDLPATIDHILFVTGHPQLTVIAHSMGTTAVYIMASTLHQYQSKIKSYISMAPVTATHHIRELLPIFWPLVTPIYNFLSTHTSGSLLEHDTLDKFILQVATTITFFGYNLFDILQFLVYGFDPFQFDKRLSPLTASHFIDGVSVKCLTHMGQFWRPGKSFANFDYGTNENIKTYGTPKPPPYNLSSIQIPVRIYYADNDPVATSIDARDLYKKLPNGVGLIRVNYTFFDHMDFLGAKDINRLLNDDVIRFIHSLTDDMESDHPTTTNPSGIIKPSSSSINADEMQKYD